MDAQNGITLYIQSGIIPFRRKDDHIEVLLITNKKKDKWGTLRRPASTAGYISHP